MPNDECTYDSTARMERGEVGSIANEAEKDLTSGDLTLVPNTPTTTSCK